MSEVLPLPNLLIPTSRQKGQGHPVPLAVDAKRLSKRLSVGVRTIRSLDAAGKLPAAVRLGSRKVWVLDEIRAWLDAGAPDRKTWAAIRGARAR
jgi:predicted DNA-binding transcriptional regulator AlpA